MLSRERKKEAIGKFKEQKISLGVYAVRCTATSRVWVGSSRNLDATRNGIWFALRNGGHREKALQEEWNAHGESGFQYEVLEKLADDVSPVNVADLLKAKKQYWMAKLGAAGLL